MFEDGDYHEYIENEKGKFRLTIWQASKAPEPGFVRWAIYYWWAEIEEWESVFPSSGYTTIDVALAKGQAYLRQVAQDFNPESLN